MLSPISGRAVVVTGASRGIGKGIARVFARQGAKVMVVSRKIEEAEACPRIGQRRAWLRGRHQ
jgi:3-oxoacyl-[acyl-carrier protein] reductase